MSMEKAAIEISEKQYELKVLRADFFMIYTSDLLSDLHEVCKLLAKNTEEAKTCADQKSIMQGIAKMSLFDLASNKYPASIIKWSINDKFFVADITATFRDEVDCSASISFPILNQDFNDYIAFLDNEANKRAVKMIEEKAKLISETEKTECELLAKLQEKYEKAKE